MDININKQLLFNDQIKIGLLLLIIKIVRSYSFMQNLIVSMCKVHAESLSLSQFG